MIFRSNLKRSPENFQQPESASPLLVRYSIRIHIPSGEAAEHSVADGSFYLGSASEPGVLRVDVEDFEPRQLHFSLRHFYARIEPLSKTVPLRVNGLLQEESVSVRVPVTLELGSVLIEIAPQESTVAPRASATSTVSRSPAVAAPAAVDEDLSFLDFGVTMAVISESSKADLELDSTAKIQKEYFIEKEIARGGMGRIYAAQDEELERTVAFKLSTAGEAKEASFWKEARVLAKLAHPNTIRIFDYGKTQDDVLYISMEYLQGQTLHHVIRPFYLMKLIHGQTLKEIIAKLREEDPETSALYTRDRLLLIFRKICDALAFAHARGVIHLDLKPENVMVGEYGEVLVMDWGLARELNATDTVSAPEGEPLAIEGTPQYMAPEQARGGVVDAR